MCSSNSTTLLKKKETLLYFKRIIEVNYNKELCLLESLRLISPVLVLETAESVCQVILITGWANSAGDVKLQVVSLPGSSREKWAQKFLDNCSSGKTVFLCFVLNIALRIIFRLNMLWPKRLIGFKLTPFQSLWKCDVMFSLTGMMQWQLHVWLGEGGRDKHMWLREC